MIIKKLKVLNEYGLHARIVSRIVQETRKFQSKVIARQGGREFDLKKTTGVFTTKAKKGDVLTVEVEGKDEDVAVAALEALFLNKFGEK